jgi:multidrug efflux pump
MNAIIHFAFAHSRTVLIALFFIIISGAIAYQKIPKESDPDIAIPVVYVSMAHEGISPEDSERLLIRPMEKELKSIEGLKEMTSNAGEGHGSIQLEFSAGFDAQKALDDVREKVDAAKVELPDATEEPEVIEINVALFPVLTITLSGAIPEQELVSIARELQDKLEALSGVLEADIGGDREALLEIIVEPAAMETYNIQYSELFSLISNNNSLVAAGAIDTGAGRLVLKVPGVVEELEDVLTMPVKVTENRVVTFNEVATIRRSFKDPQGFARVDGQQAVTLEVKKRVGANIIDTIAQVRAVVEQEKENWPTTISVGFMQDKSDDIREMLTDLQNNIISAVVLVMLVIIAALGPRSAVLVGLAIPGSFLAAILLLQVMDYTLNIVVLFSLILVVGMLVDGAIVVTELAERYHQSGQAPKDAFMNASKRMAWPVTASTITTLAVFMPLLFWPGLVGEFMKFMPITVIIALLASLSMALVFIPVLGKVVTRSKLERKDKRKDEPSIDDSEHQADEQNGMQLYTRVLRRCLARPGLALLASVGFMIACYIAYGFLGKGVEFFPEVEPTLAQVQIKSRGDLSIYEKDKLVNEVETRLLDMPELSAVYSRSFNSTQGRDLAEDVIGVIQLELVDWDKRRPANDIITELREKTADIPGVLLEIRKAENGPSSGKPIQIEFSGRDFNAIFPEVSKVTQLMEELGGFVDIEDNRPLPGIEWRIKINREIAASYGADISTLGNAIQMVTNGIKLTEYRPDDTDEEVDIRVRFPLAQRNLGQLDQLRVPTNQGMVPIGNFVSIEPAQKSGVLTRVDGKRVITVKADVEPDLLPNDQLILLQNALESASINPSVSVIFKGEDEEQQEAMGFLMGAFLVAILLMGLVLVTQFNSIYQAFIVLSAIVFSTAGVLLGLMITAQPFGIVMVGLGIIALAGIVVNNNIVLIDTYNRYLEMGLSPFDAALKTGKIRLRPVFLTAFTTVLGLVPMVLSMNIDLLHRSISFGAPSTQWWTQLASAIAGGLSFATLLTLILTPCLLVLGANTRVYVQRIRTKISLRPKVAK